MEAQREKAYSPRFLFKNFEIVNICSFVLIDTKMVFVDAEVVISGMPEFLGYASRSER